MRDLLAFLRSPYVGLGVTPLILWGILHLAAVLLGWELPWYATAAAALLLTPQMWMAGVLLAVILRYLHASDYSGSAADDWLAAAKLLRRTRRLYDVRERFSRPPFDASVYGAYAAVALVLRDHARRATLNNHMSFREETRFYRQVHNRASFRRIADFVVASSVTDLPLDGASQASQLLDVVAPTAHTRDVLEATYLDGGGILSTVNLATLLHFVDTRPHPVRSEIVAAIEVVRFDAQLLGWLGLRVIEATVALSVIDRSPIDEIRERIGMILDTVTAALQQSDSKEERDAIKWSGRAALIRVSHLRLDDG